MLCLPLYTYVSPHEYFLFLSLFPLALFCMQFCLPAWLGIYYSNSPYHVTYLPTYLPTTLPSDTEHRTQQLTKTTMTIGQDGRDIMKREGSNNKHTSHVHSIQQQ